jgi:hypothetical protein
VAYSPTTFVAGTTLTSAALQGNDQALRLYLHRGIISTDLQSSPAWIRTSHIQPPIYEPWQGVQHGVSGHAASQWGGGESVRLAFCTSYLSGGGLTGAIDWHTIPNTAVQVQIRRAAKVLFHWWVELEGGPDNVPYVAGRNEEILNRSCFIAPYIGSGGADGVVSEASQPQANHQQDFNGSPPPVGASFPYPLAAGYGQRDGVWGAEQPIGSLTIGLAAFSQIDRVAVVNWGFNLETFYL